ncbi:hypothetical protein [uncultured Tateyamaria sp.]
MTSKVVEIGRVHCAAIRIFFLGELGSELHCPMLNQRILFDALMNEGSEHDPILMGYVYV